MKKTEQWQISADAAELYERCVARHILGPWALSLVHAARLSSGDRVLDVACGTGVVTRLAADRVGPSGTVIGLDLNDAMLAVARSIVTSPATPIEWVQRSAQAIGLPDGSIDVVLCQQGLQFFPDKELALREMRRVLSAGGRLALSVWKSAGIYNGAVGKALAECVGEEVARRFCASRNVPDEDELRRLAIEAGFVDVEVRTCRLDTHLPALDDFVPSHLASTPIAAAVTDAGAEIRAKVCRSVIEQLNDYADAGGVTYPEESHLVTART